MGSKVHACSVLLLLVVSFHHSMPWLLDVIFPRDAKSRVSTNNSTPPLIIVPGNLGNRLEAKLDKPSLVHWMCYKKTFHWFPLWIDFNMLMPIGLDCWIDNIRLVYNRTTRRSSNSPGVEVRVPGFGQTYPIEFLDFNNLAGYFHTMVQHLVNIGYVRNATIRGAPYDWRYTPSKWTVLAITYRALSYHTTSYDAMHATPCRNTPYRSVQSTASCLCSALMHVGYQQRKIRPTDENQEYLAKLQGLVEEMYEQYQEPVYLMGHSMGCHYVLYFLNHQTKSWKQKYIRGFISLGAPWGGAVKPLRVMASGENDGIPMIPNIKIREEQRMTTTNPWMLPSEEAWPKDHAFISTPSFNYTNQDYKRFFTDINFEDGWHMWEDTKNLTSYLQPPGVETWCMYGVGLPTPVTYIYDENFPNSDPTGYVYADGDDTVDSLSMSLCKRWVNKQNQPVHVTEFKGLTHLDIVFHEQVLNLVQDILEGRSNTSEVVDVAAVNSTSKQP